MTHSSAPRRIPLTALATVLLTALAVAACGGDEPGGEEARPGNGTPRAQPSPPGTDIWVGTLTVEGDSVRVGNLLNATRRPGYDNQPAFVRQGDALLYTRDDDGGGTDIWRYDVREDRSEQVTRTSPESEYSATPLPRGDGFTTVRVEADSTQRLWRFPTSGENPSVLFPDVAPVGYHAWANEEWVVMFVLGEPPTLVVAGGETGRSREVASDVGRSIQSIPGEAAVSFIQRLPDDTGRDTAEDTAADTASGEAGDAAEERAVATRIMRWSPDEGVTAVTDAPAGVDDHAWGPGGLLLAGSGTEILAWREAWDGWRVVGRAPTGGTASRLAVSPDGRRIAVVIEAPDEG